MGADNTRGIPPALQTRNPNPKRVLHSSAHTELQRSGELTIVPGKNPMGAWFESILVKTEDTDGVRAVLNRVADEADCNFFLGPPIRGWISIFPEDDLGQFDPFMPEIARQLPHDIFRLIVHDDDDFIYHFYRAGELVDRYNSVPDAYEEVSEGEAMQLKGCPELFQDLLPGPNSLGKLNILLRADDEFIYESHRMQEFADVLGLPNAVCDYRYLKEGDADEIEGFDIEGWDKFVHIQPPPDPSGERKKRLEARRDKPPRSPEAALVYNLNGNEKQERGDLDGALADYAMAIELNPALAVAYCNRGLVRTAKGDLDGALVDYNLALTLNPNLAAAWNNRALLKQAKGALDGALADYNKAIEIKRAAEFYANRGGLKKAKGNLTVAVADYDEAIRLKPRSATFYNNRGESKRRMGDLDGALTDFNKAIFLDPKSAEAYNNRGGIKRKKGQLGEALADYNRAIELDPALAAAYSNRGLVRQAKGDSAGALADYNRAIELKPDLVEVYNNRGELRRSKGDWDGARADYTRAIELKPNFADAYGNRAKANRSKGDHKAALAGHARLDCC